MVNRSFQLSSGKYDFFQHAIEIPPLGIVVSHMSMSNQ